MRWVGEDPEEENRKPALDTVKKKKRIGGRGGSLKSVALQQLLFHVNHLHVCTEQIPIAAENLVSKGRVIKMHNDIKAGLHEGDKGCLLLASDLLQSDRRITLYCCARTVLLLMQLCTHVFLTPSSWDLGCCFLQTS